MTAAMHVVPGWIVGGLIYLLIGGLIVRVALSAALRLVPQPRWPRARYALAVAAFAAAVLLPLAAYGLSVVQAVGEAPAQWRTHAVAGADVELTPERAREAWLSFYLTGEPARGLALLWLVGVAVLTLRGAVSFGRLAWLRRRWRPATAAARRRLHWPDGVRLWQAPSGVPLATGVVRPGAFLPTWLAEAVDARALRSIARHELAHLRWRDPAVDLATRIVRALLWPSLGLWSIERAIRREREVACDLEAVDRSDGETALGYVETLARVARAPLAGGGATAAALGAARPGELEDRVRRLLRPRPPSCRRHSAAALIVLTLGATAINAVPFPHWLDAPTVETALWGPLDHLLGFNPAISSEMTADGPVVRIQGETLDAAASARWRRTDRTLGELAATVLEVEARAAAAPPAP
ncbi:MAG: M56 family metallopeptidase [Acidobacteriota bacterium]